MISGLPIERIQINGRTRVAAVIGWPIAHTLSPTMHNAAFSALGLDWVYIPFAVKPQELPAAVTATRALGIGGVNATVPHKEALVNLVDELTPEARAVGAVNTIIPISNKLVGHNTDVIGFERTLHRAGFEMNGSTALVIGAGGAARAVVFALLRGNARVILLNRTEERAVELLKQVEGDAVAGELNSSEITRWRDQVQLVVNTTTLGMWPESASSPWPAEIPFPSHALLSDLVYNPRQTKLVYQALQAGARFVDGLWMLVYQGAESFRLWTGQQPDEELMYQAANKQLGG